MSFQASTCDVKCLKLCQICRSVFCNKCKRKICFSFGQKDHIVLEKQHLSLLACMGNADACDEKFMSAVRQGCQLVHNVHLQFISCMH